MKPQSGSAYFYYRINDLTIYSNHCLPELTLLSRPSDCDICFTLKQSAALPIYRDWIHAFYQHDGTPWQQFGKTSEGYVIRFYQLADFHISIDGSRIDCYPIDQTETHTINHLLLDNILPYTLNLRGNIILHASAVVDDTGAIAFLAPSGTGKSTLATALCQRGYSLLSDDSVLIERRGDEFWAIPGYAGVRLWSNMVEALLGKGAVTESVAQYYDKKRIAVSTNSLPFYNEPVPLKKIYIIDTSDALDEQVSLVHVLPRDAHIALFKHSFQIDITDKNRIADSFCFFNQIVKNIPFALLTYPHKIGSLEEVVTLLVSDS